MNEDGTKELGQVISIDDENAEGCARQRGGDAERNAGCRSGASVQCRPV